LRPRRRSCLTGLFAFASSWGSFEFSSEVQFDGALRPLLRAWIPGGSLDTIVADVPEREHRVERLAAQKPRSGGWLSHLREGGGDLDSQR
jgi:hypothetical protein